MKELVIDLKDYKEDAKVFKRTAARGIIEKDGKFLIIHSKYGDYKFPGGGKEEGETLEKKEQWQVIRCCGIMEIIGKCE